MKGYKERIQQAGSKYEAALLLEAACVALPHRAYAKCVRAFVRKWGA